MLVCVLARSSASSQASSASSWLRFSLVAPEALYPEYIGDPYALNSGLRYFMLTDPSLGRPTTVLASDGEQYVQVPFT